MARQARLVVPGHPHHVTQRGIRRLETFFCEEDYRAYLKQIAESCQAAGTEVWAYALMPNHVHFIMVPSHDQGLRAAIGETHRRYTRRINARKGWRGHLWQERFHSFPMEADHCLASARYIELNPVSAGLSARPEDWPWSSARAHLAGRDDGIVRAAPLLDWVADWQAFLAGGVAELERKRLEILLRTGRPLGGEAWIEALEAAAGRRLKPRKPGRPRKDSGAKK